MALYRSLLGFIFQGKMNWDDELPSDEQIKKWAEKLSPHEKQLMEEDAHKFFAHLWRDEKLAAMRCKVISMKDWIVQKHTC